MSRMDMTKIRLLFLVLLCTIASEPAKAFFEKAECFPTGIAVDETGNLFISDICSVKKFDNKGNFLFQIGEKGKEPGQFDWANDVAVDKNGNVWVMDFSLN
jgi:hypothetical protein